MSAPVYRNGRSTGMSLMDYLYQHKTKKADKKFVHDPNKFMAADAALQSKVSALPKYNLKPDEMRSLMQQIAIDDAKKGVFSSPAKSQLAIEYSGLNDSIRDLASGFSSFSSGWPVNGCFFDSIGNQIGSYGTMGWNFRMNDTQSARQMKIMKLYNDTWDQATKQLKNGVSPDNLTVSMNLKV